MVLARRFESDAAVLTRMIQVQGGAARRRSNATEVRRHGSPPQMPDMWIPAAQALVLPGVDWLHDGNAFLGAYTPQTRNSWSRRRGDEVLARNWPLVDGKPAHLRRSTQPFSADSGEFGTFAVICRILMVAVGLIL